ncbi:MAG TPA: ATP-dependent DNA helicase [Polyangiaceae bacterium]|nr:ATP-dependent DNA helicase [Polyangiaceae bacterium]
MTTAAELLGPDGPLALAMPAYESRPGQLAMAEAVERALRDDHVLLAEAGTGTGKTLAYLVPAILSGRKIVISTATRALQEQIFYKDLPLIEKTLGLRANAALMKGLANYLCRRRFGELRQSPDAENPAVAHALSLVERWLGDAEAGDVSEIGDLNEDDPIVARFNSSSETRIGQECQYFSECFVTRMKRAAEAASIVVVNHHLFFADLALRGAHPGRVIPDYDAVIFDEAHQLEDVATTFFGVRVSEARVTRLLREVDAIVTGFERHGFKSGRLVEYARKAATDFFAQVMRSAGTPDDRVTLERDFWTGERQEAWHRLDDALDGVRALTESMRGELVTGGFTRLGAVRGPDTRFQSDALEVATRRADEVRHDLATIVDGSAGRVTWFDAGQRSASLSSSPVDLSGLLRSRLFEPIPAVVLTSATLASGPSGVQGPKAFAFVRSRLGLNADTLSVEELVVASPFDYAERALLYLPRDLPDPRDATFLDRAAERTAELVEVTGGGAFVLTTSLRAMRALHRALNLRLPHHSVFVQGERPKTALLDAFREAGNAVLVATASFWQGVDVPGDALRLVVLEKVPFPVPSDPVIMARARALEEEGKRPFNELHVPLAKIALKQGFGRLIRTRADRGIVALLDDRVHRQNYGKELLAALPPARRTSDMEDVKRFWESGTTLVKP